MKGKKKNDINVEGSGRWKGKGGRKVGECKLLAFKTLGTNVLEFQCVLCWQTMIKT